MKKFFVYLGISIIAIVFLYLAYFGYGAIKEKSEIKKYNNSVIGFTKADVKSIKNKLDNNDSFFLYIGRSTCPWCRKLISLLRDLSIKQEIEIFYLDSQDTETNAELKEFRNRYGVKYVPSILFFDKNKEYKKVDFDITVEGFDIKSLEEAISPYLSTYKK